MDNITHTLTGVILARAGLRRFGSYATLALVLAANAPDIDVAVSGRGSIAYLHYHRGYTHAIAGAPLVAALVTAVVWLATRRRGSERFRWGATYLVALAGVASHVLLDFTNVYGVRLWLPFSGQWHSWDIEFIVDPWIWGVLLVCLLGPALGRLISGEIGARPGRGTGAAILALVFLAGWWILRDLNHRRAVAMLEAHIYGVSAAVSSDSDPPRIAEGAPPLRVAAFPTALNPFEWIGVVETEKFYQRIDFDVRHPLDPTLGRVLYKPEPSPAIEAAERSRTASEFLSFARYRYATVDRREDGFRVVFVDLRFPWRCAIDLDRELRVIGERFSFRASR